MIHIIDDWYVQADDQQYTCGKLRQAQDKKDGAAKDYLIGRTYHQELSSAIMRVIRERKRERVSKDNMELKEAAIALADEQKRLETFLHRELD